MKLVQLQYFRAVCKYNNITKAAAELHITQPSISNAIKDLEEEFGVKLFHRLSKGLSLTEEGRFFQEKAEEILTISGELVQQMRDMGNKKKDVRVGVPPMVGTFLFPLLFQRFRLEHPDIQLTIMEYGSMHTRDLVADGTLDAAIVAAVTNRDGSTDPFESIRILDTETLFCTSASHPLASLNAVDIASIQDEPLVLFKEDSYQTAAIKQLFKLSGATPNVILYSSQLHTIKELVANNVASSVLFREVVDTGSDGIVGIPFRTPLVTTIQLIWNRNKYLYSDIAKFIDFTRNYQHEQSE